MVIVDIDKNPEDNGGGGGDLRNQAVTSSQ